MLSNQIDEADPLLVLLHGFPLDHEMWRPQVVKLAVQCRVVAPDFPGFGSATNLATPNSIDAMADFVVEILNGLANPGKTIICGLSMGGYVALSLAHRHPSRIDGLILADTRAEPDDDTGKANRDRMIAVVRKDGPSAIIDQMLAKLIGTTTQQTQPHVVKQVQSLGSRQPPQSIESALIAMRDRSDARPWLAKIKMPTLVIVGDEDVVTPLEMANNLVKGINGAQLEVIPRAGHLSNLENPATFNGVVSRFVSQISAKK